MTLYGVANCGVFWQNATGNLRRSMGRNLAVIQ